jgi:hypothetical protein
MTSGLLQRSECIDLDGSSLPGWQGGTLDYCTAGGTELNVRTRSVPWYSRVCGTKVGLCIDGLCGLHCLFLLVRKVLLYLTACG